MEFGKIRGLVVHNSEPVFGPGTEVLLEVKLDSAETRRPELDLDDFALCAEIVRLFHKLDAIRNGSIQQIEVRAGLPVRMILKAAVEQ